MIHAYCCRRFDCCRGVCRLQFGLLPSLPVERARFLARKAAGEGARPHAKPPVSILKPLKGTDPDMYESFRSHCLQDYPEYEIIFGVSDPDDPACVACERLQRSFRSGLFAWWCAQKN